jgi:hypothetical protein
MLTAGVIAGNHSHGKDSRSLILLPLLADNLSLIYYRT